MERQLNEEEIPTRYMYHRMKGDNFPDMQPHVRIKKWDSTMIKDVITDETYLGTMLWNRAKCGIDTGKKRVEQPREKWIVVKNQHEALVSQELFNKANDNIVGRDMSGRATGRKNLFFICGYCGKGLVLKNNKNKKYNCRSAAQQIINDCQRVKVSQKELEDAVLCQVKAMADMMMETRNIRRKAYRNDGKAVLETTAADCAKELARWKDTKVYLYEQYRAEAITREDYIARIEKGRKRAEELERTRREALAELDSIFQPVLNEKEIPDETLMTFSTLDTFDKDRLKVLIDKVLVYGEDSIEIVWKVDDPFVRIKRQ